MNNPTSQLVITSTNYDSYRNEFVVSFPIAQQFQEMQMAIVQVSLFNSFGNVSSEIGNNSFSLWFPDGDLMTEHIFQLDDGNYTVSSFQSWLKEKMDDLYLFTLSSDLSTRNYPFFMGTNYSYQNIIYFYPISPSSLKHANAMWDNPTTARCPYFDFKTLSLSRLFGYSEQIVGLTNSSITNSVVSNIVPQKNQTQSVILTSNLIANRNISYPSNIIKNIPIGNVSYGGLITNTSPKQLWLDIAPNNYNEMTIAMYSNNLLKLRLIDLNVLILVSFRQKPKK